MTGPEPTGRATDDFSPRLASRAAGREAKGWRGLFGRESGRS